MQHMVITDDSRTIWMHPQPALRAAGISVSELPIIFLTSAPSQALAVSGERLGARLTRRADHPQVLDAVRSLIPLSA